MLLSKLEHFLGVTIKAIILAGGLGTRISEETIDKPKPMVLLGNKPIVWHVMSIYATQGVTDFVIAGGYKIEVIQEWVKTLRSTWNIEVLDTGPNSQTGSRIVQSLNYIGRQRAFITYGDGLGNVNIDKLLDFHLSKLLPLTITAVRPPARFGVLESMNGVVTHFGEKNQVDAGWINGGFFVAEPEIADLQVSESTTFESELIPKLVSEGNVSAFYHDGFWQPMDTLREKNILAEIATKDEPDWLGF